MKPGFLEKLLERVGRIGPQDIQNYMLRLAREKGFLETIFNAIREGVIVTDPHGRINYLTKPRRSCSRWTRKPPPASSFPRR